MERKKFLIYDRNVESYALKCCADHCAAMAFTASEAAKTLDSVTLILRWLLDSGADRNSLLIAVGGGTTTDTAGFAASIYKRGIAFGFYPTTLLAMVDASIGGKTGVNLDGYKNMVGTFTGAEFVRRDISVLGSLPEREWRSGIAEMLKTFIIGDADSYHKAVSLFSKTVRFDCSQFCEELDRLVERAVEIKEGIVSSDPKEAGERKKLNLGHSFGHAIEWSGAPLAHGEAVAVGIIRAARISENKGLCEKGLAETLTRDFKACGLPTELPEGADEGKLKDAIRKDKKADGKDIDFILPVKLGEVRTVSLSIDSL